MRIVFFGSGAFGIPTLGALLGLRGGGASGRFEVVRVITQPDRPAGRGRRSTPTPVGEFCARHGVDFSAVERVNDAEVVGEVLATGARLGVVAAFGQKIGRGILEGLSGGCINLHASLLPKYRGAGPIQHAILNGEVETGVTVFRLTERMDAGPILTRARTQIGEHETAGELHDRLAEMGPRVLLEALGMFEGGRLPAGEAQDELQATQAPKLSKGDGVIDWGETAEGIARRARGLNPWPGATTEFVSHASGKREAVTILRARVRGGAASGAPGTLSDELVVCCGRGTIEIEEIRPAGSRAMSWRDFANGRQVRPADRFGA